MVLIAVKRSRQRLGLTLLGVACAAGIALYGVHLLHAEETSSFGGTTSTSSTLHSPLVGTMVRDVTLPSYQTGKSVTLSDFRGKPVFVNIWASWCPPCNVETPDIVSLQKIYGGKITFLSINEINEDSLSDVAKFIQKYNIDYPVVLDKNGAAADKFLVSALPTSVFINANGRIESVVVGSMSKSRLTLELNGLLT